MCAVALCAASARAASAQASAPVRLDGAHARVVVSDTSNDATVTIRWRIAAPEGVTTVPVRAIPFFGLRIGAVLTEPGDRVVEVARSATNGALEGVAPIMPGSPNLVLHYVVPDAVARDGDRLDVRVPLILPDGVASGSPDDFFTAELVVPSGVNVFESFPTVPRSQTTEAAGERFDMALQVAPSLLRWRAVHGAAPWLSFDSAVDLLLLLVLGVLGLVGLGALRRSA